MHSVLDVHHLLRLGTTNHPLLYKLDMGQTYKIRYEENKKVMTDFFNVTKLGSD